MANAITVTMDQTHFYFDKTLAPAARVTTGDHIFLETEDANGGFIATDDDLYADFAKLLAVAGGCNPITGPIYVEGANPGDFLAVDIIDIKPAYWKDEGYPALYSNLGALQHCKTGVQKAHEPRTKICRIENGYVLFPTHDGKRTIRIPLSPFIGTIGVAPKQERIASAKMGMDFCGNVDIPDISVGSTVILPVHVEGALLSLGDVHACQGDGEITACALEVQALVEIRVRILPQSEGRCISMPRLYDDKSIGVIVPLNYANYTEAMQIGYTELIRIMVSEYGFDQLDAYQLLNLVGEMRLGSELSCLCRIDRKYL